jgi:hypothetical protein
MVPVFEFRQANAVGRQVGNQTQRYSFRILVGFYRLTLLQRLLFGIGTDVALAAIAPPPPRFAIYCTALYGHSTFSFANNIKKLHSHPWLNMALVQSPKMRTEFMVFYTVEKK